jgi:hypothetical protein
MHKAITVGATAVRGSWSAGIYIHNTVTRSEAKLSLCLTKHHTMKTYWDSRGITAVLLYPRERASGTDWVGGWVGPRAGVNAVTKRKYPVIIPTGNWTPVVQLVYEGVSKSFRTGRLKRELQMIQLSATRCSCIALLWVSLLNFAAITLYVTSERVFIVVVVV